MVSSESGTRSLVGAAAALIFSVFFGERSSLGSWTMSMRYSTAMEAKLVVASSSPFSVIFRY